MTFAATIILDKINHRLNSQAKKLENLNTPLRINQRFSIKGVTGRNDNGSQFIANDVKQFLSSAEAKQEFTHIATPQENSYIEAFHSIVQTEVVDRFDFLSRRATRRE
jgi:putative transposase